MKALVEGWVKTKSKNSTRKDLHDEGIQNDVIGPKNMVNGYIGMAMVLNGKIMAWNGMKYDTKWYNCPTKWLVRNGYGTTCL